MDLDDLSVELDRLIVISVRRPQDGEVEQGGHEVGVHRDRLAVPLLRLGALPSGLIDEPEVVPGELVPRLEGEYLLVELDGLAQAALLVRLETRGQR